MPSGRSSSSSTASSNYNSSSSHVQWRLVEPDVFDVLLLCVSRSDWLCPCTSMDELVILGFTHKVRSPFVVKSVHAGNHSSFTACKIPLFDSGTSQRVKAVNSKQGRQTSYQQHPDRY